MDLTCNLALGTSYRSRSQVARVVTEDWCSRILYCVGCETDRLVQAATNTPGRDFSCRNCGEHYQLKSSSRLPTTKIVDSAYSAMIQALRSDSVPNLLALHYSAEWKIHNLLLIPRFSYSETAIEKRRPLGPNARRAGWIGCNILLSQIPPSAILEIVRNGTVRPKNAVRQAFDKLRPLSELKPEKRGWTLDVLWVVENLPKNFALSDVYEHVPQLQELHPNNLHVRDKVRQQLQVLRDMGRIRFLGNGRYEQSLR